MKVLVATDAWHPQVNGVVRTLGSLARAAGKLGVTIEFLSPEGFPSFQLPTYPGLRLAIPSRRGIAERIEAANPDAIHIATEGPIGFAVRAYCRRHGRPFTTSYTTRFPEYISARSPIPESWIYAMLRWFHAGATVTMVATPSLMSELGERGFDHLGMWTRGVDVDLFRPDRAIDLGFARPIFMTVGRVAVEKNLEAFLSLDLPGTKVVIGAGPQEAKLKRRISRRQIPRPAGKRHARRAFGGGRCFRFSEPHRYVRHRAARSAGERRSDRRFSGHRSERRRRRQSDRRFGRGSRVAPAWRRCSFRATPAASSRSTIPGKTARGNSSVTSARWRAARAAKLKRR